MHAGTNTGAGTTSGQPPIARVLLALYLGLFVVCGLAPFDRTVWIAENAPIVLLVGAMIAFARHYRFSSTAWLFMAVLPALHTIGGHYTFERVPFGFVTELFDFQRNHYDRVAHFSVGLLAFPLAELCLEHGLVRSRVVGYLFPLFTIMAAAGAYEVFEWVYAVLGDPEAGAAVLGSQGDVWDAQKDILADTLGALLALAVYALGRRRAPAGGPRP